MALGTLNVPVIAQEALSQQVRDFPFLARFSKNFSAQNLRKGQSLIVKVPNTSAAVAFNGDYTQGADSALTDATLILDQHYHKTVTLTADEKSGGAETWLPGLIQGAINEVLQKAYTRVFDMFTTGGANPTITQVKEIPLADMGYAAAVDCGAAATEAKISKRSRFMVLSTSYNAALAKDQTVISLSINPAASGAITDGVLSRVANFDVAEYSDFQNRTTPDFIEGIFGSPEAIAIATALPSIPMRRSGTYTVITDAKTGFTLQLREWSNEDKGQDYAAVEILFGSKIVDAKRLFAIVNDTPASEPAS